MDARAANDRIAAKAQKLQFLSRVPMLCECSEPGCRTLVMIGLPEYDEIRSEPDLILTAPGHGSGRAELEEDTGSYEIRRESRNCNGNGNGDRRSA
jgi:hypothetical protein